MVRCGCLLKAHFRERHIIESWLSKNITENIRIIHSPFILRKQSSSHCKSKRRPLHLYKLTSHLSGGSRKTIGIRNISPQCYFSLSSWWLFIIILFTPLSISVGPALIWSSALVTDSYTCLEVKCAPNIHQGSCLDSYTPLRRMNVCLNLSIFTPAI